MKSILKLDKKGQLRIGDAPGVVMIILFLFMVFGTSAFVLEAYQEGFGTDESITVTNETSTAAERIASATLDGAASCNSENFVIVQVLNGSATFLYESLLPANYTIVSDTGVFGNSTLAGGYGVTDWLVSYSYDYTGVACNVTEALTGEIEDNTSIAGMVLTISLIGIVLSILIGIFYVFTGKRGL